MSSQTIEARFEILDWTEKPYDEPAEGPKLMRITISKRYSGAIEGTVLPRSWPFGASRAAALSRPSAWSAV